jgi:fumarate hydratase subunit alpha
MPRTIEAEQITEVVSRLCMQAATVLPGDVEEALTRARDTETSAMAQAVLDQIIENARIARTERLPLCQDTGYAVVYVEIGQDVRVTGGYIGEAIQEGVRRGYREGCLRASVISRPFEADRNTGDNTPAIIHYDLVPGNRLKITVLPKGMGCENTSRLRMIKPSEGWEGVEAFVLDTVREAGPNACPPLIVGVGVGGTFDYCAHLAKRAVMRKLGTRNPDPQIAEIERRLEERVRAMGIGPQGLGGETTALGVHVIVHPCHIASVPVAVNIQCHSARQRTAVIE